MHGTRRAGSRLHPPSRAGLRGEGVYEVAMKRVKDKRVHPRKHWYLTIVELLPRRAERSERHPRARKERI